MEATIQLAGEPVTLLPDAGFLAIIHLWSNTWQLTSVRKILGANVVQICPSSRAGPLSISWLPNSADFFFILMFVHVNCVSKVRNRKNTVAQCGHFLPSVNFHCCLQIALSQRNIFSLNQFVFLYSVLHRFFGKWLLESADGLCQKRSLPWSLQIFNKKTWFASSSSSSSYDFQISF